MTDARMMDIEEGKVAAEKGTTKEIKDYGNLMIKDQTYLLKEIQKFAKSKNIQLPTEISDSKRDGLKDLKKENGVDLDEKFLKMIKIDHKRDVRKFKKATTINDPSTKAFAAKHLAMIESHLKEVCKIKKEY
jgi:putative membrane protein